ncbi:MAG: hypothetical protein ABIQ16_26245 [Polyangiaceae bacterium]
MTSARAVGVAVFASTMFVGASAVAAEIRWTGAASCRRELEVADQVTSMTGRTVSSIDSADFELDAQPTSDGTWQLELKTVRRADGVHSSRSLKGATCVEVTDAAAVAIALAIGSKEEPAESKAVSETAVPVAAPAPNARPVAARPKARVSTSATSLAWFAGAGGVLDSSLTPNVALGGALRLGLSFRPARASQTRLRFELEGALYAPTERASSNGQGGKFQLGYVAPLVCAERPITSSALLGCIGYELGELSGEGSGAAVTASHRRGTLWYAARAELGLLVPLGSGLRFFGRGGAALSLVRHDFVLDGTEVVFRPSAVSVRGQLGLEFSL